MSKYETAEYNEIFDCIVIGGGASGLFFGAVTKCEQRLSGLILEKTPRPGTKLLMSGNGQCNITHAGSIKDFPSHYSSSDRNIKKASKAGGRIRKCLYRHSNTELISFLSSLGVHTVTREDGKVFPESMDAGDILKALLREADRNGFTVKNSHEVTGICRLTHQNESGEKSRLWRVSCKTPKGEKAFTGRNILIASGGCSYPSTGSDGSFFNVLSRDLGLSITVLRPALSSVQVCEYPYSELSGISFRSARVSLVCPDSAQRPASDSDQSPASDFLSLQTASELGGLLLTHRDFSGPAVLNISKYACKGATMKINYIWPTSFEEALAGLKRASSNSSSSISNMLAAEFDLPSRFCKSLVSRYGESLKKLAAAITGESFTVCSVSDFASAMTTSGGIDLSSIDLSTFMLRSDGLEGVYVIGEACDIDAVTGGYSLQFAYSSACSASESILAAYGKSI